MSRVRSIVAWFLLAACASASAGQEPIIVKGKTGSIVRLDSQAKGETLWALDERLDGEERSYRDLAAKRLIVVPPAAGRYVCWMFSAEGKDGKPAVQKYVVIAEGGPLPPGPGPQPTPDTLADKLRAAFELDKAAGKGSDGDRAELAQLYRVLGQLTDYPVVVALKTVGDAHDLIHRLIDGKLAGKLPVTAKACDGYVHAKITEPESAALTKEIRDKYKAAFIEIAAALGSDPGPGPVPPGPTPIPEPGFRFLIVHESSQPLPAKQQLILTSKAISDYGTEKCAKDGAKAAFRVYDKDANVEKDHPWVAKAMQRPRAAVPWIVVSNGVSGFEGPLPPTIEDTLALLKKFGG